MSTAVVDLPSVTGLSEAQVRGKSCVWCGVILGATAVDLGPQKAQRAGDQVAWFPRGCRLCTAEHAYSAAEREEAVSEWLAAAAPKAAEAYADWTEAGVTVLPCGGTISAVRVPAAIVYAAVGTREPGRVSEYLAEALHGGPVIAGSDGTLYYVLVPPSAALRRRPPDTAFFGRTARLVVPRPDLTDSGQHGRSSYWAVPMGGPGNLCSPDAVWQLVTVGRYRKSAEGADQ